MRYETDIVKTAYVFGASMPDFDLPHVPFEVKKRQYIDYLGRKSQEKNTSAGKASLVGAAGGGLLGGALMGFRAGRPRDALVGGLVGAGIGGLSGLTAHAVDKNNIHLAKTILKGTPTEQEDALIDEISAQVDGTKTRELAVDQMRHAQLLSAIADRADAKAGITEHQYHAASGLKTLAKKKCSYCESHNSAGSMNCANCGAPLPGNSKTASAYSQAFVSLYKEAAPWATVKNLSNEARLGLKEVMGKAKPSTYGMINKGTTPVILGAPERAAFAPRTGLRPSPSFTAATP